MSYMDLAGDCAAGDCALVSIASLEMLGKDAA